MITFFPAIISLCVIAPACNTLDVRVPPSIVRSPTELKIYRSEDEITLECVADGTPKPEYEWKKNGRILSNPSNIYHIAEGTIQIKPLTLLDEGYYQCVASNQFGSALSRTTVLKRAVLSPYPPGIPVLESPPINEGQPYTLQCLPAKCVPKATYSWAIAKSSIDEYQLPVILSKRLQIDEDGALHFSYVTVADAQDRKLYKCNMYNPYLDLTMGGSYSRLNVVPVGTVPTFPPTPSFSSQSPVVALLGRNATLRCFFAGNPEPSLQWTKVSGSLPIGRHQISNYNTELTIRDIQSSDEGDYNCRASNPQASRDQRIQIDVQAVPVFQSINDRPHSVNITEGQTVTVSCTAYAEPIAEIAWLRNGIELNPAALPPKFSLSNDRRKLSIRDLCKDCENGTTDLMVIQCNASNVHGYAFGDGYINVLQKTQIITKPEDVFLLHNETDPISFACNATSDDSTPYTLQWYRLKKDNSGKIVEELVKNITDKVILGNDGNLTILLSENTSDWMKFRGTYKCRVESVYSSDEATARLIVDDPLADELIIPHAASAGIEWWIILLILLILLTILILIFCCCLCLQRSRGDTYPVDQKERKNGNNPEKELADSGFTDYQRPEVDPKGSRVSLNSSLKMDSDSEASLNEYGDIDAGKFTEDGSFIGDYGTDRRQHRHIHDYRV